MWFNAMQLKFKFKNCINNSLKDANEESYDRNKKILFYSNV